MAKVKTTLKVDGMTCEHCAHTVTKALQAVNGVRKAKVNLKKGLAQVTYDSEQVDIEVLIQAVKAVDYEAAVA